MERFLTIGGQALRLEASPRVLQAVEARFGAFGSAPSPDAITIHVDEAEPFEPQLQRASEVAVACDGDRLVLSEGVRGWYSPHERRGALVDAAGLGAVDALVRLALSLGLPAGGGLLFHGAAVAARGGAVALLGASGAGKSTAGAAFDAACDELVVARLDEGEVTLHSTPYWGGRPFTAALKAVICLERGGASVRRLRGVEAARALLRHVVRFVAIESVERPLFERCVELCRRVPVEEARCPEGKGFLPFLSNHLEVVA